jgi:hypothetical protein
VETREKGEEENEEDEADNELDEGMKIAGGSERRRGPAATGATKLIQLDLLTHTVRRALLSHAVIIYGSATLQPQPQSPDPSWSSRVAFCLSRSDSESSTRMISSR